MWRAVRAGVILRAQRADAISARPFKRDVRSREFQNDVSGEAGALSHGLGFPLIPFVLLLRARQNGFDFCARAVARVRFTGLRLASGHRRDARPTQVVPTHRLPSAPRSALFGGRGALMLLSCVAVERVVPRAQSRLVRRALTTAWNGR